MLIKFLGSRLIQSYTQKFVDMKLLYLNIRTYNIQKSFVGSTGVGDF